MREFNKQPGLISEKYLIEVARITTTDVLDKYLAEIVLAVHWYNRAGDWEFHRAIPSPTGAHHTAVSTRNRKLSSIRSCGLKKAVDFHPTQRSRR